MLGGFVLLLRTLSCFVSLLSLEMQNWGREELKNKAHTHTQKAGSLDLGRFKGDFSNAKFNYLTLLQVSSP